MVQSYILQDIIQCHIGLDDGRRRCANLVDMGFYKHLIVNYGNNEFAYEERHINAIESFWGCAKKAHQI